MRARHNPRNFIYGGRFTWLFQLQECWQMFITNRISHSSLNSFFLTGVCLILCFSCLHGTHWIISHSPGWEKESQLLNLNAVTRMRLEEVLLFCVPWLFFPSKHITVCCRGTSRWSLTYLMCKVQVFLMLRVHYFLRPQVEVLRVALILNFLRNTHIFCNSHVNL